MFILNKDQLTFADEYTIKNEPIASIELMERAARSCVTRITKNLDSSTPIVVFCGKGNNGGDGFAIARLLIERNYSCKALVINYTPSFSEDCQTNYNKLKALKPDAVFEINSEDDIEKIKFTTDDLIVDALLGTGLNKPLTGFLEIVVRFINSNFLNVISIDCPTGLFIDKANSTGDIVIHSNITLTFQYPKLSFLFSQNKHAVPHFEVLDIGLHQHLEHIIKPNLFYIVKPDIKQIITPRPKFSHKGSFGHALLIAGSTTLPGAAVIASKACLRSGAGLLTVHSTKAVINHVIDALPEAMSSIDNNERYISELPDLKKYDVVAIGPGIGTNDETQQVIKKLFNYNSASLILDADAINILSENKTWLAFLPPESILTPHPKEFDRLTQKHDDDFERFKTAQYFALNNKCILILKGTHTVICMPDGSSYFNSSGNAGLAKGGSGDTLTGVILGLIARGYTAPKAALIGVYIHGYAADLCLKKSSKESILASDVIDNLGKAFKKLE